MNPSSLSLSTTLSAEELERAKQAIGLLGLLVSRGEGHTPLSAGRSTSASDGNKPVDSTSCKLQRRVSSSMPTVVQVRGYLLKLSGLMSCALVSLEFSACFRLEQCL